MAQDDVERTPLEQRPPRPAPPQIIIQQPPTMFGRFGKWLVAALVLAVMMCVGLYASYQNYFSPADAPQEKYHSLERYATKKIAVIEIDGPIMEADGFVKKQIDRVREDDDVVAVVLRVNSPGGTVTASDYLYHHLRELAGGSERNDARNLPLVVSMGGVCASGGYYVSMAVGDQADAIFAEPTTWTGSIGVIIPRYDLTGPLGAIRVKDDSIASGEFKQMGSPTRPMSAEERELLESMVDDSFNRFKSIVLSGRPKLSEDAAAFEAVTTGRIFTANQALEHRLIDKIGFIEAAIERAAELAGESTANLRCVKYEQPPTLLGGMMGAESPLQSRSGSVDLAALLDLTAPRAYYLWTWLPTALANPR